MNPFINLDELAYFNPFEGLRAKVVHSPNQSLAFWEIDQGAHLPNHQHPHEQISIVTKGKLELTIGEITQVLEPGMVALIPSHTDHSANALTYVELTDIFYPVREDFKTANQENGK